MLPMDRTAAPMKILERFLRRAKFCASCHIEEKLPRQKYCGTCFAKLTPEVTHPSHPSHLLKLLRNGAPDYTDGKCCLCGGALGDLLYHCSICDFSLDTDCVLNPPPVAKDVPRIHEHTLTLLPIHVSFTCKACGTDGDRSPYICSPCSFIVHQSCTRLPRVIKINRHGHRISHTVLGPEIRDRVCGVCRGKINGKYGAHSCFTCTFAAHSKCATREDVWDGIELEGKEEEVEDIAPFKVIDQGVINHFSHEVHNLRLYKDSSLWDGGKRCRGCVHPLNSDPFYSCTECDFVLHEACANLHRKRQHVLSVSPLILQTEDSSSKKYFTCEICYRFCSGFRFLGEEYSGRLESSKFLESFMLDIRCGSIMEPFLHKSHPHRLFFLSEALGICKGCARKGGKGLGCDDCDYTLCFTCATLPYVVQHKCDEHPLNICYGEDASGPYWCEICEENIMDPRQWFYASDDCGFTAHVKCTLGDFYLVMPRLHFTWNGHMYESVTNNGASRPSCFQCRRRRRCQANFILKDVNDTDIYICSERCSIDRPYGCR